MVGVFTKVLEDADRSEQLAVKLLTLRGLFAEDLLDEGFGGKFFSSF